MIPWGFIKVLYCFNIEKNYFSLSLYFGKYFQFRLCNPKIQSTIIKGNIFVAKQEYKLILKECYNKIPRGAESLIFCKNIDNGNMEWQFHYTILKIEEIKYCPRCPHRLIYNCSFYTLDGIRFVFNVVWNILFIWAHLYSCNNGSKRYIASC